MERGLFSAEGRISRGTYWTRWAFALFINLVLGFICRIATVPNAAPFVGLPVIAFIVIQGVKRMHDVDKSGWYLMIPVYNFILALTEGTHGSNQYGADPLRRD